MCFRYFMRRYDGTYVHRKHAGNPGSSLSQYSSTASAVVLAAFTGPGSSPNIWSLCGHRDVIYIYDQKRSTWYLVLVCVIIGETPAADVKSVALQVLLAISDVLSAARSVKRITDADTTSNSQGVNPLPGSTGECIEKGTI